MDLSLEQKIGQMLCFGWSGATEQDKLTYSSHAREIVETMQAGGIILMGRNAAPPYFQLAETLNEMQNASRLPLLVAIDQEGGMVTRLKEPFTVFPGNMALGATRSEDYTRRAAKATAEELLALGINWDFAPCIDVNNNPDNPIIGVRSFGESPELVSKLGVAAVEGYQSAGIPASAKHFPGHGDTSVDSHLALPVIPYDEERLFSVELPPFQAVIKAGVDCIMTTHIMFPSFDTNLPATLSKPIITGLLRNRMGFDGVIVTDCLEMKAIADNYGTGEAAVMAVEAGVDFLLVCHTLRAQQETYEAVIKAVKDGRIPESRINESVERILALKWKYKLDEHRTIDPNRVPEMIGRPEHQALAQEIADNAITVVRDRDNLLPINICERCRLIVTGLHKSVEPLADVIKTIHANTQALPATRKNWEQIADETADKAVIAVLVTSPKEAWTDERDQKAQAEFVKRIYHSGTPAIVTAVREPYDLRAFIEVGTYIATYGYTNVQLKALARLLFGRIEAHGRLPVSIPGVSSG